ncbi:MAG: hypothetical protein SFW09_13310 [Hyphomicrobiaceae bacterium]|nr:hypothetical protein [Hyphomicrobiaceae bacterium]
MHRIKGFAAMVFVSSAPSDSTLIKRLDADIVQRKPEKATAAVRRGQVGEPLDDDMFPTAIWGDPHSKPITRLPHLFYANGYWCISELAKTIIEATELGRTRIHPVPIFQRDRITPVSGRFFCLNIAETKAALAPGASQGLRLNPHAKVATFNPPWVMADGSIAVRAVALQGAELWLDPSVQRVFFVSSRLGTALVDAGMSEAFRLYSCRISE